ncbi:MAG: hypothetical protein LBP63_05000 [Prevotellaceae bacterium]|jgi:uncharacterized Zn finger protein (UPF0148 family)|nr:hypothetical protein [Prevotellaceae bacterium]
MADKSVNFLQNMTNISLKQKNYAETDETLEAKTEARLCPNCGAPRAKQDGLTHCAYCGYKFIETVLTDGIFLKKEDNSEHV